MLIAVLVSLVILAVIAALAIGGTKLMQRKAIARSGSPDAAASDNTNPFPAVIATPDGERPLGDTPEAHSEITPHDLPLFHPGRAAAVAQAGGVDGQVTSGDEDPSDVSG